ncbi:hypothetical protein BKA58DRAFT_110612 [Alternaria rosae]|uniref:uncharacterized protein n=1 Tax=Alternaria rosae TaxID=1187941 RepID=UPI001E8CFEAC|nr:uncharacterized protein BKA58DRAFT_110612 [Alternaria rosae]KAH6879149.1 hypothetical protein BKA58DRAFT_110612 [Alternaria rosae]
MDRTVESFKSFIRTVPPNPSTLSDVSPLTPGSQTLYPLIIPSPPKQMDTDVNFTPWMAPTEWNTTPSAQPVPVSAPRECSPLIPEPSPSVGSIRTESWSWPAETSEFEPAPLRPVYGCSDPASNQPTRKLSRSSSHRKGLDTLISPTFSTPCADVIYQTSNDLRRAKAYVSLGIMWPREMKTGCEYWSATPDEDSTTRISPALRGKKLPPLYRTSPFLDDECEDEELSDRLQLLSFSQDYHGVLADQYYECRALRPRSSVRTVTSTGLSLCGCIPIPRFRSRTHKSMSEHPAGRKTSNLRKKSKKRSLWTPLQHISRGDRQPSLDEGIPPRFTKGSTASHQKCVSSVPSQAKGQGINKSRAGSIKHTETEKPSHISQGTASDSSSQGYRSVLFRLPRGFALVRLSSATTSHSETTSSCDALPSEHERQKSSAVSDYPWRRSSWYNSSLPTSPTALEFPPPLPVYASQIPRSQSGASSPYLASKTWVEETHDEGLPDEEGNRNSNGLVKRARDVRDTWRRHQRDTRQDKLKRSIRVVGLVDPTLAASYEKSWGR